MRPIAFIVSVALLTASVGPARAAEPPAPRVDPVLFSKLEYRPLHFKRGGRSTAVAGIPSDPFTYYFGGIGGGVWKTTDAGTTWNNVSDGFFEAGSVGAIAVADSDPNVVYVGTGTACLRTNVSPGVGIYRSGDGGKTWVHAGLRDAGQIGRVRIHPTNPDLVYAAVLGNVFKPTPTRGVFRSKDGGKTWEKVLFVDERTGASELSMDATNPRIMYAAMWEYGRLPWKVISGGPGSGLYKSTDGGETWERMKEGLPEEMGKMAIAVSRSNPEKVYALIESDSNEDERGLYVSNDAGKNWSQVTSEPRLVQRAWYYIELFVDPKNDNTIYVLSAPALRSDDGGKTWADVDGVHGDYHDMWINPANSNNLILADDGGAVVTFD